MISEDYEGDPKTSSNTWSVTSGKIKLHLQYKQEEGGTCDFRTLTALLWILWINLGTSVHFCVCSSHLTAKVVTLLSNSAVSMRLQNLSWGKLLIIGLHIFSCKVASTPLDSADIARTSWLKKDLSGTQLQVSHAYSQKHSLSSLAWQNDAILQPTDYALQGLYHLHIIREQN